jgi:hypothetical protein
MNWKAMGASVAGLAMILVAGYLAKKDIVSLESAAMLMAYGGYVMGMTKRQPKIFWPEEDTDKKAKAMKEGD